MEYQYISGINKPLSRIVYGCSSKPMERGEDCSKLFDGARELGITAFDTARGYAKSERTLGKWINERSNLDEIFVISKCGLHGFLGNDRVKPKLLRADLKRSLAELNLPKIDLYLLHRQNKKAPTGDIVEVMNEFIADGKISAWGASNWTYERIIEADEYAYKKGLKGVSASEPQFSLADVEKFVWLDCYSISGKDKAKEREWYEKTQLPILAYSPLARGFLTGKVKGDNVEGTKKLLSNAVKNMYLSDKNIERLKRAEILGEELGLSVPQVAVSYLTSSDMNVLPILGNASVKNLTHNTLGAEVKLTKEQREYLEVNLQ